MYANGCISYGPIPHSYSYVTEGSVHVSFLLLLLLLAFPRLPRLPARSCWPPPPSPQPRIYVRTWRIVVARGESEYRIDYASNDFSLNALVCHGRREPFSRMPLIGDPPRDTPRTGLWIINVIECFGFVEDVFDYGMFVSCLYHWNGKEELIRDWF